MTARTRKCDQSIIDGRLRKAIQFADAAETIREFADDEADIGDAYVTLSVHAGIAAADVLCCVSLGEHAQGDDHDAAAGLLERVPGGKELARSLRVLLGMKTRAGYDARPVSATDRTRAAPATERLVRAARERR